MNFRVRDNAIELSKQLTPVELDYLKKYHVLPNRLRGQLSKEGVEELVKYCCEPISDAVKRAIRRQLSVIDGGMR